MLIDASDAENKNRRFLQERPWAIENVAVANAAIDVLRSACYLDLTSEDQVTVLRLAVRLINAAGASGDAAVAGYYQPAASQIRDIIEVGFLLDLFRREPDVVARWRIIEPKLRRRKFSAFELRNTLDRLDGTTTYLRTTAYEFFSQHGTHADPEAIALTSPNQRTEVGPFPDRDRVVGLSFDLARYLAAATEYLALWLSQQPIPRNEMAETFAGHVLRFRKLIQGMATRTTDPHKITSGSMNGSDR